ncbi:MAG TPA: site-specific integrase [Bacillota bacterium]|nr:site-specific integrase [Bacillota bacterium]
MPSCAQLRGWSSKVKQESYVHWLRHDMGAIQTMPAEWTSEKKLERFLTRLAVQRQVAASTQNQVFNGIIFFYKEVLGRPLQNVQALRATRPAHLRHAPTVSESRALLLAVRDRGGYPTSLVSRKGVTPPGFGAILRS